jgi:outer membrane protein OmpA-like peptidoglycan-associated protein
VTGGRERAPEPWSAPRPARPAAPRAAEPDARRAAEPGRALTVPSLLRLQRQAGNRAVGRFLADAPRPATRRLARAGLLDAIDFDEMHEQIEPSFSVEANAMFDLPDAPVHPKTNWPVGRLFFGFKSIDNRPDEAVVRVKAGSSGVLTISANSTFVAPGLGTWHSSAAASWEVSASKQGALTITRSTDPTVGNDPRGVARLALTQVGVGEGKAGDRVAMVLGFTGPGIARQRSTTSKGIGLNVKVPEVDLKVFKTPEIGIGSEPDEKTTGTQTTLPTPTQSRSFLAKIQVTDTQQPPPPPKPVPPARKRSNEWRVLFPNNNADIPAHERGKLARWFDTLRPETKQKIAAGNEILSMDSYTDATGPVTYNDVLAVKRREAVEEALLGKVGRRIAWAKRGYPGEDVSATDDPHQEAHEAALRRSVISVEEPETSDVPTPDTAELVAEAGRRKAEEEAALKRQKERNKAAGTPPRIP